MLEWTSESLAVRAAGAIIPKIGLGTWQLRGERCAEIVAAALRAGYAHVDTAQGYANEEFVGEGLAASGVPRDRVFVTTKVRPDRMAEGDLQRSVDESLSKLRVVRDRPSPAPLAEPGDPAGGHDPRAQCGEAGRTGAAHRAVELHQPAARRGLAPDQRAFRGRADRIPPLSRPDEDARSASPPRHGDHRLLPDRARQGRRRSRRSRRSPGRMAARAAQVTLRWLVQQPDVVAIPKTGRSRAAARESRRFRLRADRCRDGADERADTARIAQRQRAAMGPRMGLTTSRREETMIITRRHLLKAGTAAARGEPADAVHRQGARSIRQDRGRHGSGIALRHVLQEARAPSSPRPPASRSSSSRSRMTTSASNSCSTRCPAPAASTSTSPTRCGCPSSTRRASSRT